ncbi:MAG: glutamate--tRNA ligase [Brevinematales bacterium]|nr:glutamate--tRNA ligase [Brevinematales bacterium]
MVKVRFAPSPTGKLHLGSLRTAIYNWLYAKHCNGKFVLRIEDTDLARSKKEYEDSIINDLKWLGMDYDEFYRQSDRFDVYRKYAEKLVLEGKAYYCTCSRDDILKRQNLSDNEEVYRYDGYCRNNTLKPDKPYVIRLKISEKILSFNDLVKKKISLDTKELDDFVILKQDGSPTYNFAVVVDDGEMGITHIIRGEDHITNTFKQLLVYEALNFKAPEFAHLPLVLGKDKKPLSKRLGSIDVEYYRKTGILPEALINAVARLGWGYENQEIFTIKDLIEKFDIKGLNRSNAIYDEDKIIFFNTKHIKMMKIDTLIKHFKEFLEATNLNLAGKMIDEKWLNFAIESIKDRHSTLKSLYDELLIFALEEIKIEKSVLEELNYLFSEKNMSLAYEKVKDYLIQIDINQIPGMEIENILRNIATEFNIKFGDLVRVLRIKLCGTNKSPDIITVIKLCGEIVKKRL